MNEQAKAPPAFQFYPADFIAGTAHMTTEDKGAYLMLLCYQWNHGEIPSDHRKQKLIAGCKVSGEVLEKFPADKDGIRRNERLEGERQKQAEWREKQRIKGVKSGASRRTTVEPRLNHGLTPVEPRSGCLSVGTGDEPEGNSSLFTLHSSVQKHESESTRTHEAERPGIAEVLARASVIGLAEWKACDWFDEMEGCGWLDFNHRPIERWQSVLNRVKVKWEADGRPSGPPANHAASRNGQPRSMTPMDLKTILAAKEDLAKSIHGKHCSETALGYSWNDPEKKKEWHAIRKEITTLKGKLAQMA